jgi:membrane fusion protein, copper/silver efflux system
MKKKTLIIIAVIVLLLANAFAIYYFAIRGRDTVQTTKKAELYVCPMHPQIQQDHPGVCPICNMELVLKGSSQTMDDKESSKKDKELGEITLSPTEQVLANVKTDIVKYEDFGSGIEANGVVKQRDDALRQLSSPVKGKITRLYINYEGQKVGKGQRAFEIYSPELISTQREFLLAYDNYKRNENSAYEGIKENIGSILAAARQRLKLWFMSDEQIDELAESHTIRNSISYYADYSGVVTKKYYNEGSWVMEGTTIADVVNLSSVWITANIYENELSQIRIGQSVEINLTGYGDKIVYGKIDYINPFVNPDTRTIEVRITAPNSNLLLKPEMYVKVKISTSNVSTAIVVPKNAVLRTGKMDMVYVKKSGNIFAPRDVKIGGERSGKYMITSGIDAGDEIVVSAGFLIDSESQIRMGSGNTMPGMDMPEKKNDIEIKDNDAMKDMKMK